MAIRPAVAADADRIAAIHVAGYEETYRDLAPPEVFARLDLSYRTAQWRAYFAIPDPLAGTFVAEQGSEVVGFGAGLAPPGRAGGIGIVKALYILRRAQGLGLGRALMARLAADLAGRGASGVRLDVVDGNEPAAGFYRALGGRPTTRQVDPGPVWRSPTQSYEWADVSDLTSAARGGR